MLPGRIPYKITATFFFIQLLAFETLYFKIGFLNFIKSTWDNVIVLSIALSTVLVSLFLSFVFFLNAFSSKPSSFIIYFTFFAISTFYEYGYQKALGKFATVDDVIVSMLATSEEKLYAISKSIDLIALIPCITFVLFFLISKKEENYLSLKKTMVFFLFLISFYFIPPFLREISYRHKLENIFHYNGTEKNSNLTSEIQIKMILQKMHDLDTEMPEYKISFPDISLGAFNSTFGGFLAERAASWLYSKLRRQNRMQIASPSTTKGLLPKNNIVLILDESVRGDHLSLNGYGRQTTEYLEELSQKGLLQNWGIAAAASTASQSSFEAIISGASPKQVEALGWQISTHLPSIFQYAKAMNYKVYFIEGQLREIYRGLNQKDLDYIDFFIALESLNDYKSNISAHPKEESVPWEIDIKIARITNQILKTSTGNFILVCKRGIHALYEDDYPSKETIWKPALSYDEETTRIVKIGFSEQNQTLHETTDTKINTYDNALRYNSTTFFRNLLEGIDLSSSPTIIVYTSDHGQRFDNPVPHGGKTRAEATVPLFILGNIPKAVDTKYKASHCNILPTLLDMMDYPEELRKLDYCPSLLKAKASDSKPRFFNPNLAESIPFD